MRVLVIDPILFLGPTLVQRLAAEGHEVVYSSIWGPSCESPYMDALCRGLKVKVDPDGWMNWIDWADVATITASQHRGHITHFLRGAGVPVCGPGRWATKMELDREFGHKMFREAGMKPSVQNVFTDAAKAVQFVDANPNRYIVKLDQTGRSVSETFVGVDPSGRDVRTHVEELEQDLRFADGSVKIYLDEFLDGVEVGVGGWFNGETFLGDLMVTFEPEGGYAYDFRLPADALLDTKKLEALLRKNKYRGSFDINGFLTANDEWRPIEWTPRWGAGTTEMFSFGAPDLGKLLHAAATGGKVDPVRSDLKNKLVVLVNSRDDAAEVESPSEIVLPSGAGLPFMDKASGFFPRWPCKSRDGWLSLPVLDDSERRNAVYVGVGTSLADCLARVSELASEAKISNSHVEVGRTREELGPQLDEISERLTGGSSATEWVSNMARETSHMWHPQARSMDR